MRGQLHRAVDVHRHRALLIDDHLLRRHHGGLRNRSCHRHRLRRAQTPRAQQHAANHPHRQKTLHMPILSHLPPGRRSGSSSAVQRSYMETLSHATLTSVTGSPYSILPDFSGFINRIRPFFRGKSRFLSNKSAIQHASPYNSCNYLFYSSNIFQEILTISFANSRRIGYTECINKRRTYPCEFHP